MKFLEIKLYLLVLLLNGNVQAQKSIVTDEQAWLGPV